MSVFFSGSEIVKIALGLERNGEVFYKTMAEKTPEKNAKAIYDYLAGDGELMGKASVMGALSLYLNFVNMFQMILALTGDRE